MLARNIVINLAGHVAPLIAAVFSIPILIEKIGVSNFGLLTIVWMVIGYFGVFDLGLGRALTKRVAELVKQDDEENLPIVVWTGLVLMGFFGVCAGAIVYLTAPSISRLVIGNDEHAVFQGIEAFRILAVSIPFVITSSGLRGILEAQGEFSKINLVRIPMGIWTFVGPLVSLLWSPEFSGIVIALVIGRVLTTLIYFPLVSNSLTGVFSIRTFSYIQSVQLFKFGGWITVSNLISPIMVYMDRFLIGNMLGIGAVAYYTTPYEVVFKLNFIPEAILGVMFPLMVRRRFEKQSGSSEHFDLGNTLIVFFYVPAMFLIAFFASHILDIWLGEKFSENSSDVMKILSFGLAINGFSKVSSNLLQAHGRADATALIHLIELPIYIFFIFLLIENYGLEGAALAWAGRMLLDLGLLAFLAKKLSISSVAHLKRQFVMVTLTFTLFSTTYFNLSLSSQVFLAAVLIALFYMILWFLVASIEVKEAVLSGISKFGSGVGKR